MNEPIDPHTDERLGLWVVRLVVSVDLHGWTVWSNRTDNDVYLTESGNLVLASSIEMLTPIARSVALARPLEFGPLADDEWREQILAAGSPVEYDITRLVQHLALPKVWGIELVDEVLQLLNAAWDIGNSVGSARVVELLKPGSALGDVADQLTQAMEEGGPFGPVQPVDRQQAIAAVKEILGELEHRSMLVA